MREIDLSKCKCKVCEDPATIAIIMYKNNNETGLESEETFYLCSMHETYFRNDWIY